MSAGNEVFIGLGSNLNDPQAQVEQGLAALAGIKGYTPLAASSMYLTAPVGPADQPSFINAVAKGRYAKGPHDLLADLQAIENKSGRVRDIRWGPRTLDLDILVFGDLVLDEPGLTLPHPEMWQRAFVLIPLAEIASDLILPRWKRTSVELVSRLPGTVLAQQKVVKL